MSQVQKFYAGQNVFITGGTGFLGKVLVEKLLRSCPDIGTIYLLIRAKKGKSTKERMDALVASMVFDVLRRDDPDFSKKIVGVTGDITEKGLGLSTTDHARIVDEVSVIFHLGATVRFDEELSAAVAHNVNSVEDIIDIAKSCKNLKAGIHVSTAYSHCVRNSIDETLYAPPMTHDEVNELFEHTRKNQWSEDEITNATARVMGQWPNTYVFSKAIAEDIVAKYAKDIPFAIFRPSLVISSNNEPFPGWVDSMIGVTGVMVGMGLGVIHTAPSDGKAVVDLVPVDMVCNALIVSAWKTASTERRHSEDVPVYNYVSGPENPVSWWRFYSTCKAHNSAYPPSRAIYQQSVIFTKSKWLYAILDFFLHLIPALLIDTACKLLGREPKFYRLYQKVANVFQTLRFFAIQEWTFTNHRVQNLWNLLDDRDKKIYPFSMRNVDWNQLFADQVLGIRKYLLDDPLVNKDEAKRRGLILYAIHIMVRLAFGAFGLWITWKLFCGRSFSISTHGVDSSYHIFVSK